MHVYDKVWSTNEYVDIPDWVMVDLSETDKRHIVEVQQWLATTKFISVEVVFAGRVAHSPTDTKWKLPALRITWIGWSLNMYDPETDAKISVYSSEASDNLLWDNVNRTVIERE